MSILSPTFKECTKKGFVIGSICQFHPFEWNKRKNSPQLCTDKKRLALWRANAVLTILYICFFVARCHQVNTSEDGKFSQTIKIYMILISLVYSFSAVHHWLFYHLKNDFIIYYKQTFGLADQLGVYLNEESENELERDPDPGTSSSSDNSRRQEIHSHMPKIFDLCLPFFSYLAFTFAIFLAILNVVNPNSPDFISSVICPAEGIFRWILLPPCICFQLYFNSMYLANALFYFALFLGFVFPEFIALRQIKRWLEAGHSGNGNGRIPRQRIKKILKMYRQLAILKEFFHEFACTMILPCFKYLLVIWAVLSIYGFIRSSGLLSIFLGLFSFNVLTGLTIITSSCAEIHDKSKAILELLKTHNVQNCLTPYEQKTVESFRLIRIQMRSAYYIDKQHVLTVLQIVLDETISFLIGNP